MQSLSADPFPNPAEFQEPVPVPGLPASAANMSTSSDGLFMVFAMGAPHQIYSAERTSTTEAWGNITQISAGGWQGHPSLSPDGKWLFYVESNGSTWGEIYRMTRTATGWSPGEPTKGNIHAYDREGQPFFNGQRLYFHAMMSSTRVDLFYSDYDVDTDSFSAPVALNALINDGSYNNGPRIVGDGKTLLFTSDRPGTSGPSDIWVSDWSGSDWGKPYDPDWALKSTGWDDIGWYDEAARTLYFERDGHPYQAVAVPAPGAVVLLGSGVLMAAVFRRRRRE